MLCGRRTGRRRAILAVAVLVAVLAAISAAPDAGSAGETQAVPPSQDLAILARTHRVVSSLGRHPSRTGTIRSGRPITGSRTVLPVIARARRGATDWLRVRLPGRPNGLRGWITKRGTVATITPWHIVVSTSQRRLRVYRAARLIRTFKAIVGKPSTPTPHGKFFVEESVRMTPGSPGGPFALALSARSNALKQFEGGPGQIAIHGVENLGGVFGTASSHGCVRLRNHSIRWLVRRVGAGTPVTLIR